ncbi:creatininase family protein [Limnochorda pilosa]|uniref:Creatininase n=1 Tax=Limnochorda pilosa TaxID=1555112 RepID=A0A0K2SLQ7_LIMPI|nr:creatininase family protein [Limnochorda pilosa]BAS28053.1 creatininase [Limnochorda pilosa]
MRWGEQTSRELSALGTGETIAILPVGALEQHGPHLTTDTDAFLAQHVAEEVAERARDLHLLVLPALWTGFSPHHLRFAGSVSLRSETLVQVITDLCESLNLRGLRKVLLLNGHGGNVPHLQAAAARVSSTRGMLVVVTSYFDGLGPMIAETCRDRPADIGHAGEAETSLMLAACPERVREAVRRELPEVPRPPDPPQGFVFRDFAALTTRGYFGSPARATRATGSRLMEAAIEHVHAVIRWMAAERVRFIVRMR